MRTSSVQPALRQHSTTTTIRLCLRTRAALVLLGGWFLISGQNEAVAQSPFPIESFASLDELLQEVKIQEARLDKALATEESFTKQKDKAIVQSFALLVCVGQGLAEHKDWKTAAVNGPALRDAAKTFTEELEYADAQAALQSVKAVIAGTVTGEHERFHPWNELVEMHPAMEEINTRNSEFVKVLKKPRGKPEEISPVVAWGLLGITMLADNQGSDEEEEKLWHGWSDEFMTNTVKIGEAIRKQDKDGRQWFDKASETCKSCHEKFN